MLNVVQKDEPQYLLSSVSKSYRVKECVWSYSKNAVDSLRKFSLVKRPMLELSAVQVLRGTSNREFEVPFCQAGLQGHLAGSPLGALQPGRLHPASGTSGFGFFIYLWEKIQMHIVEQLLETELGVPRVLSTIRACGK